MDIHNIKYSMAHNMFDTPLNTGGLRKCQRQAYEAILKHYGGATPERNVIIELPTGTGKTGLLAAAPFGLSVQRVLILTPNVKLAKDVACKLDIVSSPDTNVYKTFGLIDKEHLAALDLFVLRLEGTINKDDLLEHQIIVSNYQQLQNLEKWFAGNQDLIDLIIIDEAHHQAAGTYQEILTFFPNAKVIGLTATPFRTDSQRLDGTRIYKYHFHEAIGDRVIRNIRVTNVSPQQLEMTFVDQSTKQYSLKEILNLKEDAWFNRGIALSQDCCDSIAQKAKEKLDELRKANPEESHQIIAAAMHKRHARETVKPAFEKLGLRVGMVSSDDQDVDKNDETFKKLQQGKLDVIVHVGMLGEGFDHPPLGVAAIFRPFKSLNPYIQFIGRVIRENGKTPYSYVVSHLGLNQLQRFEEFRMFDYDDQQFLQELFASDATADTSFVPVEKEGSETPSERPIGPTITEIGAPIIEFGADFVDISSNVGVLVDQVHGLTKKQQAEFLKQLGLDPKKNKITIKTGPASKRLKPIDRRKASRNLLNEKEKSIAVDILKALKLGMYGRDFNPLYQNLAWVKKRVSKGVNAALKIGGNKRRDITNEQYAQIEKAGTLKKLYEDNLAYFKGKQK